MLNNTEDKEEKKNIINEMLDDISYIKNTTLLQHIKR